MDKDWASQHLANPVQYRDRKPAVPPPKPWGKIIGVLFGLGILGGTVTAWKMGLIDTYLPRLTTAGVTSDDTQPEPGAAAKSAPMAPVPTMDAKQRESILRGIDVQTRRRQEHQSRAEGLEAQIKHATAKLYPPNGSPKVDFETYMLNQIRSARASKDTSNATNLELQLGDYRRKLQELRTKLAHERDVITSCTKIIDQEKAKLAP